MIRTSPLSRRLLFLALIAMTLWPTGLLAAKGNGYVLLPEADNTNGRNVPMCREMLNIINLPENSHVTGANLQNDPVSFPKSFGKFKPVDWAVMSQQDLEKQFNMVNLHKGLEIIKQDSLVDKTWDGKGDYRFEKASVDFDGTGSIITLVRYRLPTWRYWNCLLGNDAPSNYIEVFENGLNGDRPLGAGLQCTAFSYEGRFYFAAVSGYMRLIVYKPNFVGSHQPDIMSLSNGNPQQREAGTLYNERICVLENLRSLKEHDVQHPIITRME